MSFSTLSLRQDGGVLRITLANPPINTLSAKMVEELFQLIGRLNADPDVRVVLFDSADPDFFLAHFDLNDFAAAAADPGKASKFPEINVVQSLSLSWQALPQVTVAKIKGRCRGGGLDFALGLDMRFATKDSRLCFPEASVGFVACGGGATRVALTSGPGRALEFLLSARDFSGEEAERYGLINRALSTDEIDGYVEDLVGRIGQRSAGVVAMHKDVFKRVYAPITEAVFVGCAAENDGLRAGLAGGEVQAGMGAIMQAGQTRESELDLPATIARGLSAPK